MNIGIVTTWFERGAAYVSRAYMDVLSKEHNVYIYARAGEKYAIGDPKWDLPNVTWGKPRPERIVTYVDAKDFWKWIKTNNIECLIFNEQHAWDILVELKLKAPHIPIGAYIDYYTPETVPFFEVYDFLLCNTKRHYSAFDWHSGAHYIPWGTDLKIFKPSVSSSANELTFFHSCGMDTLRKGTTAVIRAFTQILPAKVPVKLLVHSQIALPPVAHELAVQHPDSIEVYIGEVTAPGLFHKGDVYVYPTSIEGIGLTIAEALACGLPVITTNNGPMNEFVEDEVNGKLVQVERFVTRDDNYFWPESFPSESSLEAAMRFYIDHVEELPKARMAAIGYAQSHLNWSENAAGLPDLLRQYQGKGKVVSLTLLKELKNFEKRRCPNLLKAKLVKMGAGRVKRRILKLLGRDVHYPAQ